MNPNKTSFGNWDFFLGQSSSFATTPSAMANENDSSPRILTALVHLNPSTNNPHLKHIAVGKGWIMEVYLTFEIKEFKYLNLF